MHRLVALALCSSVLVLAPRARAAWPATDFDREETQEWVERSVFGSAHRAGSSDVRAGSWVSLGAFERLVGDRRDVGVMAVVGLALDRIYAGPVHAIHDRVPSYVAQEAQAGAAPPPPVLGLPLARGAVAAAFRAAGLGVDDAKIDAIVSRARLSAALPETRLRALRLVDEAGSANTAATTGEARYYDAAGSSLWLEARLTWRLDRLLYADDEPTLERVRLERLEARTRISARVLEFLFAWSRALAEAADAPPGSKERADAQRRALEAEVVLDVVTGGWFSRASKGLAQVPSPS